MPVVVHFRLKRCFLSLSSLHRSAVTNRKVVVGSCDSRNIFDLTDCDVLTTGDCSSDDLAWVQCSPTGRKAILL